VSFASYETTFEFPTNFSHKLPMEAQKLIKK